MTVFFFQAEDGIRDADVTGVQTCALPIFTEQEPHWAWEPLEAYLERLMAAVERNAMDEIRHLLAEAPTAYRPDSPIVDLQWVGRAAPAEHAPLPAVSVPLPRPEAMPSPAPATRTAELPAEAEATGEDPKGRMIQLATR